MAVSDDVAAIALDEEGNDVSWLEAWQWRNMNELRAAEASCFFDSKTASDQHGFVADPLSSDSSYEDEDLHGMKAADESPEELLIKVTSSADSKNRFSLLSSNADDCLDQFISKHGANESLNADNSPEFNQSGDVKLEFVDPRFGEKLPLVLEHAFIQDSFVLM